MAARQWLSHMKEEEKLPACIYAGGFSLTEVTKNANFRMSNFLVDGFVFLTGAKRKGQRKKHVKLLFPSP